MTDVHPCADQSAPLTIAQPFEHVTPAQVCCQLLELMQQCAQQIDKALIGRRVRVMSDHNGQPYGRSRKSWRDEVHQILAVHLDPRDGEMQLCLSGHEFGECFIPADEVEFV